MNESNFDLDKAHKEKLTSLFNAEWYSDKYKNIDFGKSSPLEHYLDCGWKEDLDPSPEFSTSFYLAAHKDVKDSGINPLLHYAIYGAAEGRATQKSNEETILRNIDVSRAEIEEIKSFINDEWYKSKYDSVDLKNYSAAEHYYLEGWHKGLNPSHNFSTERYLNLHPDVRSAGINPLLHYIRHGIVEGRAIDYEIHEGQKIKNRNKYSIINEPLNKKIFAIEKMPIELPHRSAKVVTFDIWDTVIRRYSCPEDVKLATANYFLNIAFDFIKDVCKSKKILYVLRLESEKSSVETNDYEFQYSSALRIWIENALKPGSSQALKKTLAEKIYDYELEYEKKHTFVDPTIREFIKSLTKPIYFISDFYHGKEFICSLLEHHGMIKYFVNGYVSSDYLKTKRTGDLYEVLMNDIGLKSKEIYHIGDNKHADISVPKTRYNIATFHYYNHQLDLRSKIFKQEFDCRVYKDNLNSSFDKITENFYQNAKSTSLFENGKAFAPVIYGFCLKIIEECIRTNTTKLYFFSREGYFIKKAFEEICNESIYGELLKKIEIKVLEVSRVATLLPSIEKPCLDEWMRIWNQYSTQSPKAFCSTLQLPEEVFKKIFEWYDLDFDMPIQYPWLSEKFMAALNSYEFYSNFLECRDKAKTLLVSYLNESEVLNSRFSIMVDIGWRGTIQDNISKLCNGHTRGIYLGLESFLNKQPNNCDKIGWLFDANKGSHTSKFDFAPLEMLFNGTGGSVVCYESNDKVRAKRHTIDNEEIVVQQIVNEFQRGAISEIKSICNLCEQENIDSNDLSILSLEIINFFMKAPSNTLSELFCNLTHNETFGAGKEENFSSSYEISKLDSSTISNSKIHAATSSLLKSSRWVSAVAKSNQINCFFNSLSENQKLHVPSELFFPLSDINTSNLKVGIFAPKPLIGSGGHRTIYNLAKKLYSMGYEVYVFIENSDENSISIIRNYLEYADAMIFTEWLKHIPVDIAIATIAHSASFISDLNAATKAYLIQDFEAYFNPMGDGYHVAEQSYIYGLLNCTVGNWLGHVLKTQFGSNSISSGLGVDLNTYFPMDETEKEKAICFLYQPEKPRRCPDLAIAALRLLKSRIPDLKIYLYGSDSEITLDFEVVNLGLIHDLSEINKLYNKCMVGLCLSLTNPSRIPFEVMAAGAVPVDIFRYNNLFDYEENTILLAHQSHESLAYSMEMLISDAEAYEKRRQRCIEFAKTRSLDWEMSTFVNAITFQHINGYLPEMKNTISYNERPYIPEDSIANTSSMEAFVDYQISLAKTH